MCGRASTTTPLEQIAALVGARGPFPPWRPRYNQPPGEPVANVIEMHGSRRIEPFLWGMAAKAGASRYINATAERLSKASRFTAQRGLFFVDGFYEWDRKTRQPYYIYARNRHPIPLATVYRRSTEGASCAVITTQPNELVARVHNRMPAVIPQTAWDAWLDADMTDSKKLGEILRPASADWFTMHPAPRTVNSPKNDRPELIEPDDTALIVERERKLRELLGGGREMRASDLAVALQIDYDELTDLARGMPGVELERGVCFLTKWKR